MMILNNSLRKLPATKVLISLMVLFSLIGFSDASFLASQYYLGKPITCSLLKGCETVTTSPYSKILGTPVSLFGAIYYLVIFLGLIFYLDSKNLKVLKKVCLLTIAGLLASIWFVYLQVFVIKALCLYCLLSATTSTLLCVTAIILLKAQKRI